MYQEEIFYVILHKTDLKSRKTRLCDLLRGSVFLNIIIIIIIIDFLNFILFYFIDNQNINFSVSPRKRKPSGHEKMSISNWSWPLRRMVLTAPTGPPCKG